jgi:SMI1/KNR4 family protein SUKH-1
MKADLTRFRGNVPASEQAISSFRSISKRELPDEYLRFIQKMNGGEGFVGRSGYLILWPIEELLRMNEAYLVEEYAPGLFIFGSDGGGEAFAFDLRDDRKSVVSVPFVGMDLSLANCIGQSFGEFLSNLSAS